MSVHQNISKVSGNQFSVILGLVLPQQFTLTKLLYLWKTVSIQILCLHTPISCTHFIPYYPGSDKLQ